MSKKKDLKIEFAPGAFDNFEGTQQELDEFITELKEMIQSGEFFEFGEEVDIDELLNSDDPEDRALATKLSQFLDDDHPDRNLQ
jgi:hypothetical protein